MPRNESGKLGYVKNNAKRIFLKYMVQLNKNSKSQMTFRITTFHTINIAKPQETVKILSYQVSVSIQLATLRLLSGVLTN